MIKHTSKNLSLKSDFVIGQWTGMLEVGSFRLTISFDLSQGSDGTIHTKMNCLEQGIAGLPVEVVWDENLLKFEITHPAAVFEGQFNEEKNEVNGIFLQNGISLPLILSKRKKAEDKVLTRLQEPLYPYPYIAENIKYLNTSAQVTLAGTLTLPKSEKQCPAVILIAGSGPNDRDETLFGHKPFLVLADHLTRAGIAVLRFDKRGVGESTGNYETATTEDFREDICAGIEYLKNRKEINAKLLGLIGHSEGGIIAPMVAIKSKDIAWIILMAASGVKGEELLYEQAKLISQVMGMEKEKIAQQQQLQRAMFAIVKKENDIEKAELLLREVIAKHVSEQAKNKEDVDQETFVSQIKRVNTSWFRYFLNYDPAVTLGQVNVPVLALNGELDLQVSSKQNLPAIKKSLGDSNTNFTAIEFTKLNHLFQTCESGSITEYAMLEETISPLALKVITDWIFTTCEKLLVQNAEI